LDLQSKEEEMTKYQSFLASNVVNIFEALDDGVYVTDKEGTTLHVNSMYTKLTGLTSEELLGQNVRVLQEKGIFDTVVNPIIVKTRKPETDVQTLQDGKRVVLRGFPVFDDNKELVLVITLVRDVTLMEQLRTQIVQQKKLLSLYQNQIELLSKQYVGSHQSYETLQDEKLAKLVKRIASTDSIVLLFGEKGVGKDRVARLAHANSPRKNEIFFKVDCSPISKDRIESEFFGFVPDPLDAFTSADSDGKMGYFEAANKGTVFLDEISVLPLTIQAKLLRLLQDQEVMRVGSPVPKKVNVRIIAATSTNLEDEIKKGNFSEDLFNKLREKIITIPPLREIPEMIPSIVDYYLKRYGVKYKKDMNCPNETMSMFLAYQWPGNIRELENTIQSLFMTCEGNEIPPHNLPPSMHASKDA
jgi:PAS domain S-box-containing protein